jgi:hypothetical protein
MRTLSIAAVLTVLGLAGGTVLGLAAGTTIVNQQAANALAQAEGVRRPSIMIGQLTANTKDLPVRSFDAF